MTSKNTEKNHSSNCSPPGQSQVRLHEKLEERVLFDAVMDGSLVECAPDDPSVPVIESSHELFEANSATAGTEQSPAHQRNELVFVDRSVEGYRLLVADLLATNAVDVYFLDGDSDGLSQIADVLAERNNVDAIHIISHGSEAELQLGSTTLTAESINGEHADELATIRAALTDSADLLIYGCNFGAGTDGQNAAEALAVATGADVAASDDLTGGFDLGADWDLEFTTGSIETTVLSSENWSGVLDADGDGLANTDDADDDNDGILDTIERIGAQALNTTIFLNDNNQDLIRVDDINGEPGFTTVGNLGRTFGDIGIAPDGTLYGLDFFNRELYSIDTETAAVTLQGTLPASIANPNGLSFDEDGFAYVGNPSTSQIFRFDPADPGSAAVWYDFGVGNSGGDFVFLDDAALVAWNNNGTFELRRVALDANNNAISDTVLGVLPEDTFGLTADAFGQIYAVAESPAGQSALFRIDVPRTPLSGGSGALAITEIPGSVLPTGQFFGATSNVEALLGTNRDTDGDGIADHSDLDSDNDGISDLHESGNQQAIDADTNNDGFVSRDEAAAAGFTDENSDGIWDQLRVLPVDSDGDSTPDYLDLDSDGDGIPDTIEARRSRDFAPNDGDVTDDDADGDGIIDLFDSNDNTSGNFGGSFTTPVDTDVDGTPDFLDLDSDDNLGDTNGDDATEAGTIATAPTFADPDGSVNNPLSTGAGLPNTDLDPTEVDFRSVDVIPDLDGDGVSDEDDIDDDNDGILDSAEGFSEPGENLNFSDDVNPSAAVTTFGTAPTRSFQLNQEDVPAWFTTAPDGLIELWESGHNGVLAQSGAHFAEINATDSGAILFQDLDVVPGDIVEYSVYHRGRDGVDQAGVLLGAPGEEVLHQTLTTDNTDWVRYTGTYTVPEGVTTLRFGLSSISSASANAAAGNFVDNISITVQRDTDGDGAFDHQDLDSDNDGISDLFESQAVARDADTNSDGTVTEAESLAYLQANVDADITSGDANGDGLLDIFDASVNTSLANGILGTTPVDSDGDGRADVVDLDSDNDLIADTVEAFATNNFSTTFANDGNVTDDDADGDGVIALHDNNDSTVGGFGGSFVTPQNTDGTDNFDFLDTDSDNDGLTDTAESGLTATGNDLNNDGIDDGVGASSADPNGSVNNPSADLNNQFGDTTEVAFREAVAEFEITGASSGDEGDTVQYTIALNNELLRAGDSVSVDLSIDNIDTSSSDYADIIAAVNAAVSAYTGPGSLAFNGTTLTFTATNNLDQMSSLVVDLELATDNLVEGDETFAFRLTNPVSSQGDGAAILSATNNRVTTTIGDQSVPGSLNLSGPSAINEGEVAVYTLSLSGSYGADQSVSVTIGLSDITTNSSDYANVLTAIQNAADANDDVTFDGTDTLTYTSPSDGASLTGLTIALPITNDALIEGAEQFTLAISDATSSSGATIGIDNATVTTTINDTQIAAGPDLDGPAEFSITGSTSVNEGQDAAYTISLSGQFGDGEIVTVNLSLADIDTNSSDYADFLDAIEAAVATNDNVTFDGTDTLTYTSPADGTSFADLTITLPITNDVFIEGAEHFSLTLSDAASSTGANVGIDNASLTTTINDTQIAADPELDGPAEFSITGSTSINEGQDATYTISLSGQFGDGEIVTVNLSLADIDTNSSDYGNILTAVQNAANANDNVTFDGTDTLTYTSPADGTSFADLIITLPITNDVFIEGTEDFSLTLSDAASSTGANVGIDNASLTTTINDTQIAAGPDLDGPAEFSITGSTSVNEGQDATYTISLSGQFGDGEIVTVNLNLADIDTNSSDYADFLDAIEAAVATNDDITFDGTDTLTYTSPADGTSFADLIITLPITNDAFIEGTEDFSLTLSDAASSTGANVGIDNASLTTTINDTQIAAGPDLDGPGEFSISGSANVNEGQEATYIISLSGQFGENEVATVNVNLNNIDTNSSDYASILDAIAAAVATNDDVEFDGSNTLTYSAPSEGASFADLTITLAITNDAFIEGAEDFSLTLSNAASSTGINVGIDNASVTTTINDTQLPAGPDLDGPGEFSITGSTSVNEGADAIYTISLSGQFGEGEVLNVSLNLSDINTNSSDYADILTAIQNAANTNDDVTFDGTDTLTYTSPADGTSFADLTITLPITNDAFIEGTEDFSLTLSDATSPTVASVDINNASVTTTISDTQLAAGPDLDGPGEFSITGSTSVNEGADATFIISLSGQFGQDEVVTVNLDLSDIDTNNSDHTNILDAITAAVATNDNITFDGTDTLTYTSPTDGTSFANLSITLPITNDALIEGAETFSLTLSAAASSTGANVGIDNASVTTTINDTIDDSGVIEEGTFTIAGDNSVDEGGAAIYTVSLAGTLQNGEVASATLALNDIDTTPADRAAFADAVQSAVSSRSDLSFDSDTGVLTYTADGNPFADLTISLNAIDDDLIEGPEHFRITIANATSSTGASVAVDTNANEVTTTINDTLGDGGENEQAVFSITGDTSVDEGGSATYTISLAGTLQNGEVIGVTLALNDIDTTPADRAAFADAVQSAVSSRSDLSFDSDTGVLTYTGDGNPFADLTISLDAIDDAIIEGPEDLRVTIANATSSTGASVAVDTNANEVTTTINDTVGDGGENEQAVFSITGDTSVDEGGAAIYTVSLAGTLQGGEVIGVTLALSDIDTTPDDRATFADAVQAAVSSRSDLSFDSDTGVLTYTADGNPFADLTISLDAIDDAIIEGPEDLRVTIANATSSTGASVAVDTNASEVTTTINDDDSAIWSIAGPTTINEGDSGTFTISLAGVPQAGEQISIQLNAVDVDTTAGDYSNFIEAVATAADSRPDVAFNANTRTLTYTSTGSALADFTFDLTAETDVLAEGAEAFRIVLANPASSTGADVLLGTSAVTVTINDQTAASVWNLTGPANVNEGANAVYTLSLSGTWGTGETVSVDIDLINIDTNSSDYGNILDAVQAAADTNADVTFDGVSTLTYTAPSDGASLPDLTITLPITNDVLIEGSERFRLQVSDATSSATAVSIANASVTTTINDTQLAVGPDLDGPGEFSISGSTSVNEGQDATYTISLSGQFGNGEIVTVNLNLSDIDTNSSDYTNIVDAITAAVATNDSVTFDGTDTLTYTSPADGTSFADLIVTLPITNDAFIEGTEDFSLTLSAAASSTGASVGIDNAVITTTINDTQVAAGPDLDGPPEFSLTGSTSVNEGASATYTVALSGQFGAGEVVSVDLDLVNIDTNSSDYGNILTAIQDAANANTNVIFDGVSTLTYTAPSDGASFSDLTVSLPIGDDSFAEGAEGFRLELSNPLSSTGVAPTLSATQASVNTTIVDNDSAIWSISGPASINEGATGTFTISLAGTPQAGEQISIQLSLVDLDTTSADYSSFITAVSTGADSRADIAFDSGTGTLTYTSTGSPLVDFTFDLTAQTDALSEGPEDFRIELANPASATGANVLLGTSAATVTINDQTGESVWNLAGPANVDEGDSAVYTLSLSGTWGIGETVSVDLDLINIDTNSSDYGNILDAIQAAADTNPDVTFDGVSTLTYTAASDGASLPNLTITLPITNDALIEGSESFRLEVSDATSSAAAVSIANGSVTTTIGDTQTPGGALDGPAEFSITGSTSVNEGANATYTISLSGQFGADEIVSVNLDLTNIDTNSSDYSNILTAIADAAGANDDVTFDGVSTLTYTSPSDGASLPDLTITLPITNDAFIEGPEDFSLTLSAATSSTGANVAIDNASVTTTINDTQVAAGPDLDGPAQFSITGSTSVNEGANATYTISLSGQFGAGEIVSVNLDLTNIDTSSSDYSNILTAIAAAASANDDVTFDGVSTLTYTSPSDGASLSDLTITLPVTNDAFIEGPEDFSLTLSAAASSTGANVGIDNASVTTTINDTQAAAGPDLDGPALFSITGPSSIDEGDTADFEVALSGTFGADETVTVAINFNALDTTSSDYSSVIAAIQAAADANDNVTFDGVDLLTYTAPSDGSSLTPLTISLAITNDILVEGQEDFGFTLSSANSSTGANVAIDSDADSVVTTIDDTQGPGGEVDGPAIWRITGDTSVDEGVVATYTVSLSEVLQAGEVIAVDLTLTDNTTTAADRENFVAAVNSAISGRTELSFDGTTLTYTGTGTSLDDIVITLGTVNDDLVEGPENYTVQLSGATTTTGAAVAIDSAATAVTTTINDTQNPDGTADTALFSITGDTSVDEGGTTTYTIALDSLLQAGETATVELSVADVDTTSADYADFATAVQEAISTRSDLTFDSDTGELTFTSSGTLMTPLTISLAATDDSFVEGPEDFRITLSNASSSTGAAIGIDTDNDAVTTTINDTIGNDGQTEAVVFSLTGDATVAEGNAAVYTLSLSGNLQSGEAVHVNLTQADIDTTSADYAGFTAAVQTAVTNYNNGGNPGSVSFDAATGVFTFVSDGSGTLTPVSISLDTVDDVVAEGTEAFRVELSDASSSTGAAVSIDTTADEVVTSIDDTSGPGADSVIWSITGSPTVDEGASATYTISLSGLLQAGENAMAVLAIGDLSTTGSDYGDFASAVQAAVSGRSDLTFDSDTGTLTYTGDGSPFADLAITLAAADDIFAEGPEEFTVTLTSPGSTTGVVVSTNTLSQSVTTTINDTQGPDGSLDGPVEWIITGTTIVPEGSSASYNISVTGNLQTGEQTTTQLTLANIDTTSADYGDFAAAVNSAVSSYAGPGSITFDDATGTLTFISDGTGPMEPLTINLTTTSNDSVEGPEQFRIELTNAQSATGLSPMIPDTGGSVTTTIVDGQSLAWSLSGPAAADEGANAQFIVTLAGTLQSGAEASVEIRLTDLDTNSTDYGNFATAVQAAVASRTDVTFDSATGTLTFTGTGSPFADLAIDLPITDDVLSEGPEQFRVELTNAASSTGVSIVADPGADSVTTTINDTQGPNGATDAAIWVITGSATAEEGATARYTISLNGTLQAGENATVQVGLLQDDTTSADYADVATAVQTAVSNYTGPGSLSFNASTGALTFVSDGNPLADLVFDVAITDDAILEGPENFRISLSSATSTTGTAVTIDTIQAEVTTTINDTQGPGGNLDGLAVFSIVGDNSVDEGAAATFTISLSETLQSGEQSSVQISLGDVDTNSDDYADVAAAIVTAVSTRNDLSFDTATGTLTFTSDGTPMTALEFTLQTTDDSVVEGPEDFQISLSNAASSTGIAVTIDPAASAATTTINDTQGPGGVADQAEFSIVGDSSVNEGGTASFTIALDATLQSGEVASIDVLLVDVDTNRNDYADFNTAIQNAIAGRPELSFDTDNGRLTFTSDGNPLANIEIALDATDDVFVEGPEQFRVALANAQSSTGSVITVDPASNNVTTTINDTVGDDNIAEQAVFSVTGDTSVDEGGAAIYTVSLAGILQGGEVASVTLALNDIDTTPADRAAFATAVQSAVSTRSDLSFDSDTGVLTYTADGNPFADLTISLDAIDDDFIEGPEDFQITLANATSSTGASVAVDTNANEVTTTINDTVGDGGVNEQAVFSIAGDTSVDEGGAAIYTVSLAGTLQGGEVASVTLALSDIDTTPADRAAFATAVQAAVSSRSDLSFDSDTGVLTYTGDGNPFADLTISLDAIDDAIIEGPENFRITLANATSSTGASVAVDTNASEVTTTINDTLGDGGSDEQAVFSITGDTSVDEGGSATYTVSLAGTLQGGEVASVTLALSDIDTTPADRAAFADAVQAAVNTRSELTFDSATGVLSYTSDGGPFTDLIISLDAIDDTIIEGPEDLRVSLSNAVGTAIAIDPTQNAVTTTINDTVGDSGVDEQAVFSIAGDTSVDEGGATIYTVSLAGTLQGGEVASVTLALNDIDTTPADRAALATAVQAAVSGRSDLSFDSDNGVLTYTANGNPFADLAISLDAIDDDLIEGPEDFQIVISDATSSTGVAVAVDIDNNAVTTTINDTVGDGGVNEQAVFSIAGDTSVDEGGSATYTVSLAGTLQNGEVISVTLALNDIDTTPADRAALATAVQAAVSSRSDLSFDSDTGVLTYTADGNPFADLAVSLDAIDDDLIEGPETLNIALSAAGSSTGAVVIVDANQDNVTTVINDTVGEGGVLESGIWSIAGPASIDEGETGTFIISLNGTLQAGETASVDLALSDIDTTAADYTDFVTAVQTAVSSRSDLSFDSSTGRLTYTGDGSSLTPLAIALTAVDDAFTEGPEAFRITLANATSSTGAVITIDPAADDVTTTINDTQGIGGVPDAALLSITGTSIVEEGGFATYIISLDGVLQAGETATVELGLNNIDTTSTDYDNLVTAVQTALSGRSDVTFDAVSGTLTYTGNDQPLEDITLTLAAQVDQSLEGDEDYTVFLANPDSSTGVPITITADSVTTTIADRETADPTSPGNTPPIATDDTASTQVDTAVSGQVLSNDGDPDGDLITINTIPTMLPTNGTVIINGDGTFTYTPDSGFAGRDSFAYEITDADGNTDTATVIITVSPDTNGPSNDAPVANADGRITQKNTPVSGNVLDNDSDSNPGDVLSVTFINGTPVLPGTPTFITTPSGGSVEINSDGSYTYTPGEDFVGTETFTYTIDDGNGGTDITTVVLSVFNNPPVAGDDVGLGTKNDPITGDLLANDSDPNGDPLTINTTPVSSPANGTLVINPDGTYEYTPNNDFVGSDSFTYEVCDDDGACVTAMVSLTVVARPPVALPDTFTGTADEPITGNVLTNDSDPDTGDTLTVTPTPVTPPTSGTVTLSPDGAFVYTPGPEFAGTDTFEYEVCDESGNCDTAVVTIVVADISAAKEVLSVVPNGENFDVTFEVAVQNTGGTPLEDLQLTEDLTAQFGSAFVSVTDPILDATGIISGVAPQINPAWSNNTSVDLLDPSFTLERLNPGESFTLTFTVTVDPDAGGTSGPLSNQVEITAVDNTTGIPQTVTDLSDSGGNPQTTNPDNPSDTGGEDDPTEVLIGDAGLAKEVTSIVRNGTGFDLTIELNLENTGTVGLNNLTLNDDLMGQFGIHFGDVVSAPVIISSTATSDPILNPSYEADTTQNIFDGTSGELKPGESITVQIVVFVDATGASQTTLSNQATGGGQPLNSDGTPLTNLDGSTAGPVVDLSDSGADPNGFNPGAPGDTGTTSDPTTTVLNFYTFDSFNEFSEGIGREFNTDVAPTERVLLSRQISSLAPEPIYSGSARPGTRIIGRIYDSAGNIIAEEMSFADTGGNWMMQMHNVAGDDHYRIEFVEVVGQADTFGAYGDIYGYLGVDGHSNDYAALEPLTAYGERYTVGSVYRGSVEQTMESAHRTNNNPLGLGTRNAPGEDS